MSLAVKNAKKSSSSFVNSTTRIYPLRKRILLQEYKDLLDTSTTFVLAKIPGLPTSAWWDLRKAVVPYRYRVKCIHNRIFEIAGFPKALQGPHLLLYTKEPEHPSDLKKSLKCLPKSAKIALGRLQDGTLCSEDQVRWFSELPDLPTVRGQLVHTILQGVSWPLQLLTPMQSLVMYLQLRVEQGKSEEK